jgi:hypothetical protein
VRGRSKRLSFYPSCFNAGLKHWFAGLDVIGYHLAVAQINELLLIMFKKRELKASKNQCNRRRKREDEDDSEDHSVDDLQEALSVTKQRRTLIDQLQNRRGVDASELLKKKVDVLENKPSDILVEGVKKANPTAADALSSKTQLPTGGTVVAEEQKIWDQKHAAAMEEYVQERLMQTETNSASSVSMEPAISAAGDDAGKPNIASKDQLYRELAAQAAKLSGKTFIAKTDSNKVHDNNEKDVHAAGAATALAEVILPVSDRLLAVRATAQAAAQASITSSLPNVRLNRSAVPNRFRSSTNHHHPLMNQGGARSSRNQVVDAEASSIDEDRPGFAAARQLQQQKSFRSPGGHPQSTDDRVYQQFVKRQREQQNR